MIKWTTIEAEIDGIRNEMAFLRNFLNSESVFHTPVIDEVERLNKRLKRFRLVIERADCEFPINKQDAILLSSIQHEAYFLRNLYKGAVAGDKICFDESVNLYDVGPMWEAFFEYINQ